MTNSELQEILLLLQSDKNKKILMKKISALEADRLNISHPSVDLFIDENTKHRGTYKNDTVCINKKCRIESYNDYLRFLETIIHETRHKYQLSAIQSPEKHPEMKENIRDYLEDAAIHYPKRGDIEYHKNIGRML